MKTILLIITLLFSFATYSQTSYVKVVDKPEFAKFMNYCQTPVPRTFYMRGEVSVVKYNPDYTNTFLYYAQPNGDWMAKYPLVIKWWPVGFNNTTTEAYQHGITAKFEVMVPRIYCRTKTEYITMFYAHWKNNEIQEGWWDSHSIGIAP